MYIDSHKKDFKLLRGEYPTNIVELWCRHVRSYGDATTLSILNLVSNPMANDWSGGFAWVLSPEGDSAWKKALLGHNYDSVYSKSNISNHYYIDFKCY